MFVALLLLLAIKFLSEVSGARILAVYPSSLRSHHVVFRPLTIELIERGHEVVTITANRIFPEGRAPKNLTEIDVFNVSHSTWLEITPKSKQEARDRHYSLATKLFADVFKEVLKVEEVQNIIRSDQHFDLLLLEACMRPALIFSHFFKAPVIQISSYYPAIDTFAVTGAPSHPLLYPTFLHRRLYNLSWWEKVEELYSHVRYHLTHSDHVHEEDVMLQRFFGKDIPGLQELVKNVDMFFDNLHPIWADNQPQPPSIVHIGGIHQNSVAELPPDLKAYLDSSKNGVIYISFGTTIATSQIPRDLINVLIEVVSQIPYDVLLKWDDGELPGTTKNIKTSKWFPQPDLLKHPNIKVFITQAGLQSTGDAIVAGVPVIGIPLIADQFCNAEKYVKHGIGVRLDADNLKKDDIRNALEYVIGNDSFRRNVERLRNIMEDEPQTSLERAIWWIEYVIRHGGAKHLRAPAAHMSWSQYLELQVVCILTICLVVSITILVMILYYVRSFLRRIVLQVKEGKKKMY